MVFLINNEGDAHVFIYLNDFLTFYVNNNCLLSHMPFKHAVNKSYNDAENVKTHELFV